MKNILYLSILALVVILSACGMNNGGYHNITSKEAKELIDNQKVVILDVRTPEEFQEGHIPDATLLPLQELEARMNELEKDETYLVVCRSGNRSSQASDMLAKNGFTNIYNITEGMNNWLYEIEQ
ncbi:MAG TPA: rhodanese-like domain-containing protein [Pseudoneobacillus sp.]|nr:rhodanese-like domain-containing protein [Pseudoneobacillus sp.]